MENKAGNLSPDLIIRTVSPANPGPPSLIFLVSSFSKIQIYNIMLSLPETVEAMMARKTRRANLSLTTEQRSKLEQLSRSRTAPLREIQRRMFFL